MFRVMLKNLPADVVYSEMPSPVGKLTLLASSQGLYAIFWEKDLKDRFCKKKIASLKKSHTHKIIQKTKKQLREYFAGKRHKFVLPLVLVGTPFQLKAWCELSKIPYGKTMSYSEQAKKMGNANKARAVGMANSRNPISIVIPCHRVIGKNGKLTGFAGGLDKKKYLLELEVQKKKLESKFF